MEYTEISHEEQGPIRIIRFERPEVRNCIGPATHEDITGRVVDAEEALRIGLANEVVPRGQSLTRAIELARFIAELPPQLRQHFESAGWSKGDIRRYVFERARIHRREWADCGKAAVVGDKGGREYAALPDPDHLLVIAAGGPAGGFGAVIPPWLGTRSRAVMLPVGACIDCGPEATRKSDEH